MISKKGKWNAVTVCSDGVVENNLAYLEVFRESQSAIVNNSVALLPALAAMSLKTQSLSYADLVLDADLSDRKKPSK